MLASANRETGRSADPAIGRSVHRWSARSADLDSRRCAEARIHPSADPQIRYDTSNTALDEGVEQIARAIKRFAKTNAPLLLTPTTPIASLADRATLRRPQLVRALGCDVTQRQLASPRFAPSRNGRMVFENHMLEN
jgi:hypothetical protein